jgi:hypothetical protein
MQQMSSNELSNLSPKALKEYISAYNLPSKAAIEKSDLVRIIFNTRPISNESENHYRNCRRKQPNVSSSNSTSTSNSNEDSGNSFSFSNMVQELFTPPPIPPVPSPRAQQRQQQEQQQRQQQQVRLQQQRQQEQARRQQEQARLQQQQQQQQREEQMRILREQQQRQPSPPQRHSPTNNVNRQASPSSPPLSNDNLLSLHDLVKTKIDPASLSVRTLKSILKANFVEQSHVIEKSELIKLVVRLADQHRAEIEGNKKSDEDNGGNEENLCRICFDNQQNCVFLDCGHMVTCMECAKKVNIFFFVEK